MEIEAVKYPWMKSALTDYGPLEMPVSESIKYIFAEHPNKLLKRIFSILSDISARKEKFSTPYDSDHFLSYPIIRIIIGMIGDSKLNHATANLYAKAAESEMKKLSKKYLVSIGKDLGLGCSDYKIDIPTYLGYIHIMQKSEKIKLINNKIKDGKVVFDKKGFIQLLKEIIRNRVMPQHIHPYLAKELEQIPEIKQSIDIFKPKFITIKHDFSGTELSDYPPCIDNILKKQSSGTNLSHTERLVLVFFLNGIGKSKEEIIDSFRITPDFSEDMTKYFVNHAVLMNYKPYGCAKMKSFNLCVPNILCERGGRTKVGEKKPIIGPLDYVFWSSVMFRRLKSPLKNK